MYAVIVTGGKQYKVSEGDVLYIEKLDAEAEAKITTTLFTESYTLAISARVQIAPTTALLLLDTFSKGVIEM